MSQVAAREYLWNGLLLRDFVSHFYQTVRQVRQTCLAYTTDSSLHFRELNTLVRREVFPLKEASHRMFRMAEEIADDRDNEAISTGTVLDLTLGVLFHEILDMKEQVYLLDYYQPRLAQVTDSSVAAEAEVLQRLVNQAAELLPRTIAAVEELLSTALELFHRLLPIWSDQPMVVLFLASNNQLLDEIYHTDGVATVFGHMFTHGAGEGWHVAGRFLWDLGHAEPALDAFEKSLAACNGQTGRDGRCEQIAELCQSLAAGHVWPASDDLKQRARNLARRLCRCEQGDV